MKNAGLFWSGGTGCVGASCTFQGTLKHFGHMLFRAIAREPLQLNSDHYIGLIVTQNGSLCVAFPWLPVLRPFSPKGPTSESGFSKAPSENVWAQDSGHANVRRAAPAGSCKLYTGVLDIDVNLC